MDKSACKGTDFLWAFGCKGVPPMESLTFGSKTTIILRLIKENYQNTSMNISCTSLNSGQKNHS